MHMGMLSPRTDHSQHRGKMDQFAGYIVLGSSSQEANHSMYDPERELMREAVEQRCIAFLGICHGCQLLAHYCGMTLHPGRRYLDKGLTTIHPTGSPPVDPIARCIASNPVMMQWHKSHFTMNEALRDVANIANSPDRSHCDVFWLTGTRAYGLQGHPELDEETSSKWIRDLKKADRPSPERCREACRSGRDLIDAWIQLALSTAPVSAPCVSGTD